VRRFRIRVDHHTRRKVTKAMKRKTIMLDVRLRENAWGGYRKWEGGNLGMFVGVMKTVIEAMSRRLPTRGKGNWRTKQKNRDGNKTTAFRETGSGSA